MAKKAMKKAVRKTKASSKRNAVSTKSVTKARMSKEKVKPEYLVLTVPQSVKEGASFKLLQVADSYEEAEKYINTLNGNASKLLCIFEKKKFLQRQPVMTTSELQRNLMSAR